MTTEEARKRVEADPDFVHLPRFECSLKRVLRRYPEGAPDKVIAQALMITEEDVAALFDTAVKKLRRLMRVR